MRVPGSVTAANVAVLVHLQPCSLGHRTDCIGKYLDIETILKDMNDIKIWTKEEYMKKIWQAKKKFTKRRCLTQWFSVMPTLKRE